MKTPKTPPPPDPVATANAQTAMNVKTATNQQQLNMVDQYTPEGSLKYTQIGTWADGTPKYQVNQAYSPEQQRLYETNVATDQNLANLAKSQSGFLNEYMDRPVDLSAEAVSARQSSMGMPASVQWEGNIKPTTTAGSWNAERINPIAIGSNENLAQSLFDSAARRMGNTVERDYDNMQSKLAARGIKPGSAAWDRAQNVFDERINDQYNQLYVAAQDQAFNQAAQRSQIGFNQALTGQGQYFDQRLAGQQQQFAQDLSAQNTNFNNALQAQTTAYDQAMAARQQAIQEMLTERNQPLQEINALMSGSQVSQPTFGNTPKTQVAPVDYTGLVSNIYNTASQNAIAKANAQNQMIGSMIGAAGNIAGMGIYKWSDKRMKKNIQKVGETKGLNVYKYEGKKGTPVSPMQQVGLMAQEVEKKRPDAVRTNPDGSKMVDYAKALGGKDGR